MPPGDHEQHDTASGAGGHGAAAGHADAPQPSDPAAIADPAAAAADLATSPHAPADQASDSPEPAASSAAGPRQQGPQHSTVARAIALELWNQRVPATQITERTGIKRHTLNSLVKKAKQRGFTRGSKVIEAYVVDAPRAGRPRKSDQQAAGKQGIES